MTESKPSPNTQIILYPLKYASVSAIHMIRIKIQSCAPIVIVVKMIRDQIQCKSWYTTRYVSAIHTIRDEIQSGVPIQ